MDRQIKRLQKAIDELIKIHDDGKGSDATQRAIDSLNHEISSRENNQK